MTLDQIRQVGIIGAGTMGCEIGFVCSLAGYPTLLYDVQQQQIDVARQRLEVLAQSYINSGSITEEQGRKALSGIDTTMDLEEAAQADLLSESVFEEVSAKKDVWSRLGKVAPEGTIFTTNTSSLAPSDYAAETGRPEKFAAMHFHLPVLANRIVDVMTHGGTSVATMDLVEAFVESLDLIPVRIEKESPAYIFNAMLIGYLREAVRLMANDVATPEQIDKVWTTISGTTAGPFLIMDYVGVDTAWRILKKLADDQNDDGLKRACTRLESMVESGRVGMKSGHGFYEHPGNSQA
ncbi:MAG: 3-hydroxyacyl-CoA dehydrogenase [Pseudomonadales bacterium]|nr:3-hydroxyacyl-CoA dehydrogenase [Pseudomonadales bacterium]